MAENTPTPPGGALPPRPPEAAKVQPKKKGPDDDDVPVAQPRQEFVLIVIRSEPMQQK